MRVEQRVRNFFHGVLFRVPGLKKEETSVDLTPEMRVYSFSFMLLQQLGAFDNPDFGPIERSVLTDKFSSNLLDNVFTANPRDSLDEKKHHVDREEELKGALRTSLTGKDYPPNWEKAIYLEARNILLTKVIPALRSEEGMVGTFMGDFISSVEGIPQNRFIGCFRPELRLGVNYRIEQLIKQLDEIKQPVIRPS